MVRFTFFNRVDMPLKVLCLFLIVVFVTGGSSRSDVLSLLLLRPLSVAIAAYGLAGLTKHDLRVNWAAFAILGLSIGLALVHLLPLPPQVWQALPGREIVVSIDQAAGIKQQWRPLSLDPNGTANAFWALLVPAASMVLAVRIRAEQKYLLLTLLLSIVVASACLAIIQGMGDPNGPTYLYRITNNGALVGLFANRNHQALLLAMAFPMLALWFYVTPAISASSRMWHALPATLATVAIAGLLLLLILVTGSRAGIVLGSLALLSAGLIHVHAQQSRVSQIRIKPAEPNWSRWYKLGLALCIPLLIALAVFLDRDLALDRLTSRSSADELRVLILPTMFAMIRLYGVLGSGLGSFAAVYKIHEPDELLGPAYANHAHNDWLELAMTGGLPALVIVFLLVVATLHRIIRLLRTRHSPSDCDRFALLGLVLAFLSAVASIGDYPLRVPSLEAVFAIAMVWALAEASGDQSLARPGR